MNKTYNTCSFIRGDNFNFKILLLDANNIPIIPNRIKELFVTFRQYPNDDYPILFQKTLEDVFVDDNGYCHVSFLPEDTENLSYGKYYFDMEVTLNNNYRKSRLYEIELTKETTIHRTAGDI